MQKLAGVKRNDLAAAFAGDGAGTIWDQAGLASQQDAGSLPMNLHRLAVQQVITVQ